MEPIFVLQQRELDRHKRAPHIPGRMNPQMVEPKETRFLEGTKYRLFVLSDQDKIEVGYRLRPVPIDPMIDYTDLFEDFNIFDSDRYGKPAFEAALEKFNDGNEEYSRLLEQTRILKHPGMTADRESFERRLTFNLLKRHNQKHAARIKGAETLERKISMTMGYSQKVKGNSDEIVRMNDDAIKYIDTMPLNNLWDLCRTNSEFLKTPL